MAPDAVFHALTTQKIELVLTAHPTEVNRRTYLNKHKKVRDVDGDVWLCCWIDWCLPDSRVDADGNVWLCRADWSTLAGPSD